MATVTLHKSDCKLSPTTLNVKSGDSVSFDFETAGTLNSSNAAFFGVSTISSNQDLTVQPNQTSTTITVVARTCTPSGQAMEHGTEHEYAHPKHEQGQHASASAVEVNGDSCVITVSSFPS